MSSNLPRAADFKQELDERLQEDLSELDKLTEKQRQAFFNLIKRPEAGKLAAARLAGYSVNSISRASGIFKTIEGKLGKTFRDVAGVDETDLVCAFASGLRADKVVAIKVGVFEAKPLTNAKGEILGYQSIKTSEEVRVVNLGADIRLRVDTAKHIARMGGYEAPVKMQLEHTHSHELGEDTLARLKREAREIEDQRRRILDTDCEVIDGDSDPSTNG